MGPHLPGRRQREVLKPPSLGFRSRPAGPPAGLFRGGTEWGRGVATRPSRIRALGQLNRMEPSPRARTSPGAMRFGYCALRSQGLPHLPVRVTFLCGPKEKSPKEKACLDTAPVLAGGHREHFSIRHPGSIEKRRASMHAARWVQVDHRWITPGNINSRASTRCRGPSQRGERRASPAGVERSGTHFLARRSQWVAIQRCSLSCSVIAAPSRPG